MENAIPYLEELENALWELKTYPPTGRDEMWGARVDSYSTAVDKAGRQLTADEDLPEGNEEIQENFKKLGRAMIDVANAMHHTWINARVGDSEGNPGPWEKSASQAEDALDNAASALEDNLELITEDCDL